jgi:uncharacterized protein YeeX (DUF496 family)
MNDKQIAENTWKTIEFVKTLTDDPASQALLCLNANSWIQNQVSVEAVRQLIANMFKK